MNRIFPSLSALKQKLLASITTSSVHLNGQFPDDLQPSCQCTCNEQTRNHYTYRPIIHRFANINGCVLMSA